MSKSKGVRNAAKATPGKISRPAALKPSHDVSHFDCGRAQLNTWLIERAKKADEEGTARTFVVCRGSRRVIGFYSLAAGSVEHAAAPGRLRRNTPDPIPIVILARLGVDKSEQNQGLGQDLLSDAMRRTLLAARHIGARAMLVHALDAAAAKFYKAHNFAALTSAEETFFLTLKEMSAALG